MEHLLAVILLGGATLLVATLFAVDAYSRLYGEGRNRRSARRRRARERTDWGRGDRDR